MLFFIQVPKHYWGKVVLTAAYLINRLLILVLGKKSPIEVLLNPSSLFVVPPKVIGCVCFVHNYSPSKKKLDSRAIKCLCRLLTHTKRL